MGTSLSDYLVDVSNLHFSYFDQAVLDDITLKIPAGQIAAVMGSSGCGKTTLLRLISGQLRPRRGRVEVMNQSVPDLDSEGLLSLRRKMGMLFQMGGLFTDLSVFENVAFPVREHTDLPEDLLSYLVLMKLHAVGLRGAYHLMPSELSGGMERRVALARTIVLDPVLILYDEPFAGLDPISMAVIGRLIRTLNDALGATSIIVTHDVQESLKVVDFLYLMSHGKIVAQGSTEEMQQSTNPLVRQFVDGEPDGPVEFHLPAQDYPDMLRNFQQ